jgi:transcriptional regulator with XRE-family HTH domain
VNERIKELRKALKMSQTEFGNKFGVGLGVIRNFEYGLTVPSEVQLNLICATFDVNREWLLYGNGEMFRELTHREKVVDFIGEALADESNSFRLSMIELLADLTPEDWVYLEKLARTFARKIDTKKEDSG